MLKLVSTVLFAALSFALISLTIYMTCSGRSASAEQGKNRETAESYFEKTKASELNSFV